MWFDRIVLFPNVKLKTVKLDLSDKNDLGENKMLNRFLIQVPSLVVLLVLGVFQTSTVFGDPCGMVPPVYGGGVVPISRVGLQQTYVFYKDGVETFVIRPGFSGKVDEFGMLIPFPTPPAIRKVPDNIFAQVANAIDPPEVVINLFPRRRFARGRVDSKSLDTLRLSKRSKEESVKVLREEAVGMYEVAVLEAGSAKALKKWMDNKGYVYPKGMDEPCNEYVEAGWCFVAVKTKVGDKSAVDPKAGQRSVNPKLPKGATFDGFVQGMGFRFKSDELVVPMRLSTFNEGDTRNVVYLLTEGPQKINRIPEEFVQRQISGKQLIKNVTELLPVRFIGGNPDYVKRYPMESIKQMRDPESKNGAAKALFASDLHAVASGQLSLEHEEREKELLRVGEYFGLRGKEIDAVNAMAFKKNSKSAVQRGINHLEGMTLTVVDGDFPRDALAKQNLTFATYKMPEKENTYEAYDPKTNKPGKVKNGIRKVGSFDHLSTDQLIAELRNDMGLPKIAKSENTFAKFSSYFGAITVLSLIGMMAGGIVVIRKWKGKGNMNSLPCVLFIATLIFCAQAAAQDADMGTLIKRLGNKKTADEAIKSIVGKAKKDEKTREAIVKELVKVAKKNEDFPTRGWAIAALTQISGQDVDEMLLEIHSDSSQDMLVRTWAAAGRVKMVKTMAGLIEKARLIQTFPSLGRPIGKRILEKVAEDEEITPEKLISISNSIFQLRSALIPAITGLGAEKLTKTMTTAKDNNIRRSAASYLATMANNGDEQVKSEIIKVYNFSKQVKEIPWKGGALFIPGLGWDKSGGIELAGNLVAWHVYCDQNELSSEKNQIHNNLRSISLQNVCGYDRPPIFWKRHESLAQELGKSCQKRRHSETAKESWG